MRRQLFVRGEYAVAAALDVAAFHGVTATIRSPSRRTMGSIGSQAASPFSIDREALHIRGVTAGRRLGTPYTMSYRDPSAA